MQNSLLCCIQYKLGTAFLEFFSGKLVDVFLSLFLTTNSEFSELGFELSRKRMFKYRNKRAK